MRWIQENTFLAGLAAVTVVVTGVMIFLLTQAMGEYQTTSEAYVQAVQKLHGLQNRSPFPSEDNLAKTKALASEYKSELQKLHAQLAKMEAPLNPDIKPQQFQDALRTALNQTVEKATAAGVVLPRDFYLGFGQYANTLPSEQAAPYLARQLGIITQVVGRLIDYKVQSIDSLDRRLLPEEGPAPAGNNAKKAAPVVERFPFDITFTADQPKFRLVFNSLLGSEPYLIVRSLNVINTGEQEGPTINKGDSASASNIATSTPGATAPNNNLDVILGREQVKASLRIEIIDFANPEEPKK